MNCPKCHSLKVLRRGKPLEMDNGKIHRRYRCTECGHAFVVEYKPQRRYGK